jgi:hypothetical protein
MVFLKINSNFKCKTDVCTDQVCARYEDEGQLADLTPKKSSAAPKANNMPELDIISH